MPKITASPIVLSESDYNRIMALLDSLDSDNLLPLENELTRAKVVPLSKLPANTVAMGSTVTIEALESGKTTTVTLAYPNEANVEEMKISVRCPVGGGLLGLRVGGTIDWPLPSRGQRRLEVLAVEQHKAECSIIPG